MAIIINLDVVMAKQNEPDGAVWKGGHYPCQPFYIEK